MTTTTPTVDVCAPFVRVLPLSSSVKIGSDAGENGKRSRCAAARKLFRGRANSINESAIRERSRFDARNIPIQFTRFHDDTCNRVISIAATCAALCKPCWDWLCLHRVDWHDLCRSRDPVGICRSSESRATSKESTDAIGVTCLFILSTSSYNRAVSEVRGDIFRTCAMRAQTKERLSIYVRNYNTKYMNINV